MITLTAEMRITGIPISPFIIGASKLGYGDRFKTISTVGGTPFKIGESILGDGSVFFVETIGYQEEEIVKIDRRSIVSLESEVKERADIDKPSFGIFSTGGSLSFKDSSSRFLNYANAGLLTDGIEIKIFLENTIKKTKKQVGLYYTDDWDYDNDNRMVSVSFADNLEKLQSSIVSLEDTVSPQNMYEILQWLLSKNLNIDSTCIFTEAAKSSLENTRCEYPVLEEGKSLWNHIDQICKICGLCAYQNNNKIVFSTNLNERS